MSYSEEFRASLVERILSGEISVSAAAQTYKLAPQTIRAWRDKALAANMQASSNNKKSDMKRLILPKNISYLKAHEAVILMRVLEESAFGKYCRKEGITTEDVKKWKLWFDEHPEACNREDLTTTQKELRGLVRENAEMNRELEKQKTALSKTATMLLLSKKAEAIWGKKDN